MTLTGIPFFVVVIAATVAAFVAAPVWVPRTGRSVRGFAARLLTQAGVSAMALLLVAVVLNNANGWYAGWGDLLGGDAPSVQSDTGGASAAKALQAKPAGPGMAASRPATLPALPSPGGWPIATGVIEGACRFLVADRLDITGARWGLVGAEAVLQLRALRSNGDFDEYWTFHQAQERQRIHATRYADNVIPLAA